MFLRYYDGEFTTIPAITNEVRVEAYQDSEIEIFRFENGVFQQLEVDVDTADGEDADAVEVDNDFYSIGDDSWNEVPAKK